MYNPSKHIMVNLRDHMREDVDFQTAVDETSLDGDVYTRVFFRRNTDNSLAIKSELSNKVNGKYTNKVYTFYDIDGTTVLGTLNRTLTHYPNGVVTEINS